MNARSHADRGQLFGYDGQTMWIEQTLEVAPTPADWLRGQDSPTRCGPSHLCDSMSGCQHGPVVISTPYGPFPGRLGDCLRPGDRRARVHVCLDPERPQFAYARFVPADTITVTK